ncbi:helix-turn-helix domain-containing protein [Pontibacter sp. G13]|uniref:winged helix-turn-helix transcriptional regulator n=1 Tax=Pontibacter sp. G13 TaxID=3074898 RepID=UPI00288A66F6|nr:helix-turn-helix domain-containing protein [Pontibacter sp. G13]WNJ19085.1 helix-turn-helix domain-containing protein [Pontibacter sp. G13]
MKKEPRSHCSINLALEVFGDKWTLLIIRDIMLGDKRHFREILQSDERISSNILTTRLNMLEEQGIITKQKDDSHKQKFLYSLTAKGIDLLPVITAMAEWSLKHEPVDEVSSQHTQALVDGGAPLVRQFMKTLTDKHLPTDDQAQSAK